MNTLGDHSWINGYIGIPYRPGGRDRRGVDCYGLVMLVMLERFGQLLPDWGADLIDLRNRSGTIESVVCSGEWTDKDQPDDGDIIVCRRARAGYHIGVIFGGGVLHALEGTGVVYEPLSRFVQQYARVQIGEWNP